MSLNFPDAPSEGDTFSAPNGASWMYSGGLWVILAQEAALPNLPSMVISAPTYNLHTNTGTVAPVQTTLTSDSSNGQFTYDSAIAETGTQALGGIVVPAGIYAVTLDFYVNSLTGVVPLSSDAINTRISHRTYPSGGTKLVESSYIPRGVITTVEMSLMWTIKTAAGVRSKVWVEYFQTMTLPAPTSAAGAGAASSGKFTFTVSQLQAQ